MTDTRAVQGVPYRLQSVAPMGREILRQSDDRKSGGSFVSYGWRSIEQVLLTVEVNVSEILGRVGCALDRATNTKATTSFIILFAEVNSRLKSTLY